MKPFLRFLIMLAIYGVIYHFIDESLARPAVYAIAVYILADAFVTGAVNGLTKETVIENNKGSTINVGKGNKFN